MSGSVMAWAMEQAVGDTFDKLVLILIGDVTPPDGVWPEDLDYIAKLAESDATAVGAALARLEAKRFIRRRGGQVIFNI